MQNTPTPQQELFFGDAYANILATMKQHMLLLPNDEMIDEGLAVVRQYKDVSVWPYPCAHSFSTMTN
jgi:hypothetical protein